jgi:hypothetical protein
MAHLRLIINLFGKEGENFKEKRKIFKVGGKEEKYLGIFSLYVKNFQEQHMVFYSICQSFLL